MHQKRVHVLSIFPFLSPCKPGRQATHSTPAKESANNQSVLQRYLQAGSIYTSLRACIVLFLFVPNFGSVPSKFGFGAAVWVADDILVEERIFQVSQLYGAAVCVVRRYFQSESLVVTITYQGSGPFLFLNLRTASSKAFSCI